MDFGLICDKGHEYPSYKDSCSVCWAEEVNAMADKYPGWTLDENSPPGIILGKCHACGEEAEPAKNGDCPNCHWCDEYPGRRPITMPDRGYAISCQARHVLRGEKYELYGGCPLCKMSVAECHVPQQSYLYGEENCIVVKNKKTGKTWVDGGDKYYIRALRILAAVGLRKSYSKYMYQTDMFIGSPTDNIWLIFDTYSLPMDGMRSWSVCSQSGKEILADICTILRYNHQNAAKEYKKSKKECSLNLGDCRVKDMLINLESKYKPNQNHDFLGRGAAY